ncbi:sugar porter (SP) family MFS transporter [Spizellomyces punctatus DAOM BR117]|uniref:Sugar porter (SP) family MFS transporter n=1 Tax=Spizellomyces punctatus (strain DAOM BR117) TaxID=645134 RepID=A0A0L0HI08_SPIPD|nr:sugar porter (SP) family MFS transporter [Spizellomyces punctatus DAOM BR117]KND00732.1 sugar porter (SP) family MFS transporter [Spizellomyces punctatus DAOM BR117]|eukprot:XP_016608771.1 sugar porter (SP) family MFS transporter [Spizellomyces punctatus DAOM BR117]
MAQHSEPTSPYLLFCVIVGSLTAFQFGYNSGVVNQPRDAMTNCPSAPGEWPQNCIPMDDWQWGIFVSMFLLGGIIGGLTGGHIADNLGRRRTLLILNVGFIIGGALLALSSAPFSLYFGRFIIGIAAGTGTVAVPLYISEISPVEKRGTLGSFNQLAIVVGILVSVLVGIPLATLERWRYMFGLILVPSILQMLLIPFCVETPSWLTSQSLVLDAKEALQKLNGTALENDEAARMLRSHSSLSQEQDIEGGEQNGDDISDGDGPSQDAKISLKEIMTRPELWKPIVAGLGLHASQQFSGINAAIYYSTTIFSQSYSQSTAIKLTVLLSLVNLAFTLVSGNQIDKVGRRTLLLVSQGGMAACALGAVGAFRLHADPSVVVLFLMAFVGMFAVGLGNIPWLIMPELVPSSLLGPSASVGTAVNWSSAFIIALVFPRAIAILGYDIFYVFAAILVGSSLFTYLCVPETKGKTPEEVARTFMIRHRE